MTKVGVSPSVLPLDSKPPGIRGQSSGLHPEAEAASLQLMSLLTVITKLYLISPETQLFHGKELVQHQAGGLSPPGFSVLGMGAGGREDPSLRPGPLRLSPLPLTSPPTPNPQPTLPKTATFSLNPYKAYKHMLVVTNRCHRFLWAAASVLAETHINSSSSHLPHTRLLIQPRLGPPDCQDSRSGVSARAHFVSSSGVTSFLTVAGPVPLSLQSFAHQ